MRGVEPVFWLSTCSTGTIWLYCVCAGATGRAFLFNRVVNLNYSEVQDRVMLTGRHMVRDVSCKKCDAKLGWIYEFATEENQRYKEGRVILERALVTESEGFDDQPAPNQNDSWWGEVLTDVSDSVNDGFSSKDWNCVMLHPAKRPVLFALWGSCWEIGMGCVVPLLQGVREYPLTLCLWWL